MRSRHLAPLLGALCAFAPLRDNGDTKIRLGCVIEGFKHRVVAFAVTVRGVSGLSP